jgi:hypothetical protein
VRSGALRCVRKAEAILSLKKRNVQHKGRNQRLADGKLGKKRQVGEGRGKGERTANREMTVTARHSTTAGWETSTRGMVEGEEEVA